MEIFDIISSLLEKKENLRNDTEYTFFNKKVLYASSAEADHSFFGIDIVVDLAAKEMIVSNLIAKLGFPTESSENNWYVESTQNSDFLESKIEKKSFITIDITNIKEIVKLDLLRWNYENFTITISDYPLVRGFPADTFYINIR